MMNSFKFSLVHFFGFIFASFILTEVHADSSNQDLMSQGLWQDSKTELVWMRCSLGQTWNGKTCIGKGIKYKWKDAFKAVETLNRQGFAGYHDWRLPDVEELTSIRYCSKGFESIRNIPAQSGEEKSVQEYCKGKNYQRPTINLNIFPNTAHDSYWSSSPSENYLSGNKAWDVNFKYGYPNDYYPNDTSYVRAVRDAQNK